MEQPFKVGDDVIIAFPEDPFFQSKIGEIIEVDDDEALYPFKVKFTDTTEWFSAEEMVRNA